jgi:hypothetical protein
LGFDGFIIISLIYAVIGVQAVYKLIRNWRATWDLTFTQQDRILVDQAAFFVLVPVSVLLHEGGHAVMVKVFGAEIVDFGFYGFAGYVSYVGRLNDVEQMIIAAAGVFVNLILCLLALGAVFLKRPPFRAAINELLIQFTFISALNAFVVYPVLDVLSGLNGDWRQMYDGGVPWLTAVIVGVQAAILAAGYWMISAPGPKARIAALTDIPPGLDRGAMGGLKRGTVAPQSLSPTERLLNEAVSRVSSGWPQRVTTGIQRFPQGTAMTLEWNNGRRPHVAAARAFATGRTDIVGFRVPDNSSQPAPPVVLHSWAIPPSVDELTIALRLGMETVDREDW